MTKFKLKLYILGQTSTSQNVITSLKGILETESSIKGGYELEVVDVLKHPQLAEDEKIIATPALIKYLPEPVRKIIGDLSDREKVLVGLDFIKVKEKAEQEKKVK